MKFYHFNHRDLKVIAHLRATPPGKPNPLVALVDKTHNAESSACELVGALRAIRYSHASTVIPRASSGTLACLSWLSACSHCRRQRCSTCSTRVVLPEWALDAVAEEWVIFQMWGGLGKAWNWSKTYCSPASR
jgi:hypothetical protein